MDNHQYKVYLGWVNHQLKKRSEQSLIKDLSMDMADGTVLANLIEVVAGERLEIASAPSQQSEKVANVEKVLQFMKANRIPMHPLHPQDIVSGDIKSIMRLILALAARYKPNTVKQTNRRGTSTKTSGALSVVGYAQSAVAALADARRNASIVIPKPQKPDSLSDGVLCESAERLPEFSNDRQVVQPSSRTSSMGSSNSKHLPKSSSQDFNKHVVQSEMPYQIENDARYQELVSMYRSLESEHKELRLQHEFLRSVCYDACTEVKILRKLLVSLQELLEHGDEECNDIQSSTVDESLTSADFVNLKNRLLLSEEICCDVKEDLSKTRSECLRLQGTETGLHQRLHQQQKAQFDLKAELSRVSYERQLLLSDKTELEKQLLENKKRLADLSVVNRKQSGFPLQELDKNNCHLENLKVIYFAGRNEIPQMCSFKKHLLNVTLKDVKCLLNPKRRCRYKFRTQNTEFRFIKEQISQDDALVPIYDGTVMVWLEDE